MNGWTFAELLSLIPIIGTALAFLALYLRAKPPTPALPLLLLLVLSLRWLFLIRFGNPSGDLGFDTESYRIVGSLLRAGDDVYANTDRHPYLPFQMYFMGLASWLDAHTDPKFYAWIRWPNIIADIGITILIYRSLRRLGRDDSECFWLTAIWAMHPISIYTSTIHAQFDSIAVFFALWSWYLVYFWRNWSGVILGGVMLGFAILDKTWPLILLPPLLVVAPQVPRRLVFVVSAAVIPLLGVAVYDQIIGTTRDLIERKVIDYDAVPMRYGFTYAFSHYLNGDVPSSWLPYFQENGREIFLLSVIIVAAIVVPRRDALTASIALLAGFLVFAHGWGSQYLLWVIPFAIIARQRAMLALYSAVATAAVYVYYWGSCGYHCPGRLEDTHQYWQFAWVWPVAMLWLAREIGGALAAGRPNDSPLLLATRSLRSRWLARPRPSAESVTG
jgi:hypothetical protein